MRKLLTIAGIGILSMLMGITSLTWAQDEPKPPRQDEPRAEPKPEPRQQEQKPPKEDETRPQKQDEMKPPKHEDKQRREDAGQGERPQQNAARPANGKGGHIPDNKFRSHFGRGHTFVINQPVVVEGQPRFQSGGYWFVIADPWPDEWAYSDECYVDYEDGDYFLFDLMHPGVRVLLFVVM